MVADPEKSLEYFESLEEEVSALRCAQVAQQVVHAQWSFGNVTGRCPRSGPVIVAAAYNLCRLDAPMGGFQQARLDIPKTTSILVPGWPPHSHCCPCDPPRHLVHLPACPQEAEDEPGSKLPKIKSKKDMDDLIASGEWALLRVGGRCTGS